jgi:hypothetical protein
MTACLASTLKSSHDWLGSGTQRSETRAIGAAGSNNKLGHDAISLREAIPFWFAVSSPLIGLLVGLMGAWFVTWLSA